LDRVGDDPMVTDLIFLMADGIDRPADQAAHLRCERKAVYNAIRRLDSHVASLRANLALEDAHGL
jgi:hypothetical protein